MRVTSTNSVGVMLLLVVVLLGQMMLMRHMLPVTSSLMVEGLCWMFVHGCLCRRSMRQQSKGQLCCCEQPAACLAQ